MEKQLKIACLGGKNSYTGQIARKIFQQVPEENFSSEPIIKRVIRKVEQEKVDYGVIPLENRYEGVVRETLRDLRKSQGVVINHEDWMEIHHCFGALKDHEIISKIHSKDQALNQCEEWLEENYPEAYLVPVENTELAARQISELGLKDVGAIASKKAITESGLELLAENFVKNNRTRFIVLGKNYSEPTEDDKTMLVIHPLERDRPGTLYDTLGFLKREGLNLETLESRPDSNNGYYFYLELNGHFRDEKVSNSIKLINGFLGSEIKILGSYKNSHWKE